MSTSCEIKGTFRVIIVGGSIAGLVLAHCLEKAGIDYVVLEQHHEIAPQIGASVGIMPNGARILDQLSLLDAVEREIEPLVMNHICYPDGFDFSSAFPTLLAKKFGYSIAFLERQKFLDILYNRLRNKSSVHVGKGVVTIEQAREGVCVRTKDQACYYGDLVVGADGVHSQVRAEMWRIADTTSPGLIGPKEKAGEQGQPAIATRSANLSPTATFAEYACVFGISSPVPGLTKGEAIACFYDHLTILTMHGKGGRVFWFVLEKMEDKYRFPDIPRFDDIDAEKTCARICGHKVFQEVSFGKIWDAREIFSMVALEENVFERWHHDRIVCLGDSMHKMTPNLGQGANSAIESAAALANNLHHLTQTQGIRKPSTQQIEACLEAFSSTRLPRAKSIVKEAGFLTRLQARDGLMNCFIGRYIVPYAGDFPAAHASKVVRAAPKLDYLPLTDRVGNGWQPELHRPTPRREHMKKAVLLTIRACASSGALIPALPAYTYVSVRLRPLRHGLIISSIPGIPLR
ncbi:MAG: hypothetical protein Q9225_000822 [Loekoesia sp. 1 TL-2023]